MAHYRLISSDLLNLTPCLKGPIKEKKPKHKTIQNLSQECVLMKVYNRKIN